MERLTLKKGSKEHVALQKLYSLLNSGKTENLVSKLEEELKNVQSTPKIDLTKLLGPVCVRGNDSYALYDPLIFKVLSHKDLQLLKLLFKFTKDEEYANATNNNKRSVLQAVFDTYSSNLNDEKIIDVLKFLLSNGANMNSNVNDWDESNVIMKALYHKKWVDILQLLCDPQQKYKFKHRFDWDNLINKPFSNGDGTIFTAICAMIKIFNDAHIVDILEYLFSFEKYYKTKIDISAKTKKNVNFLYICGYKYEKLFNVISANCDSTIMEEAINTQFGDDCGYCPLLYSGSVNGADQCQWVTKLLSFGANPNFLVKDQPVFFTLIQNVPEQYRIDMLRLLVNPTNTYKHSFDWVSVLYFCIFICCLKIGVFFDRYINWVNPTDGLTLFEYCCTKLFPCVKDLIAIDKSNKFKTKIDYGGENSKDTNRSPLSIACEMVKSEEICQYMIKNVYYKGSGYEWCVYGQKNKQTPLNHDSKDYNGPDDWGNTAWKARVCIPFARAIKNDNLGMIKALVKEYGVSCAKSLTSDDWRILLSECDAKIPMWLISCGIQSVNDTFIKHSVFKIISEGAMYQRKQEEKTYKWIIVFSILDNVVSLGNIHDFKAALRFIVKLYNIKRWKEFLDVECMNQKSFEKWHKIISVSSNINVILASFLMSLKQKAWDEENFGIFQLMISDDHNENETGQNEEVINLTQVLKKDLATAKYLISKCKQSTLNDLSNVINNGLLNYECGFNDSLLLLSKMVNEKKFSQCLENVTDECLSNDKKTTIKRCFFKNNLLHSNVWAMKQETEKENETTTEMKETQVKLNDKITKLNDEINDSLLLFDKINNSIIANELKSQQMFIQNAIISEEKTNEKLWKELKSYKTNANNNKSRPEIWQSSIIAEYELSDLPDIGSNVNGFDSLKEYDHNVHLTRLLINAYRIDPIFQRDCKKLFVEYFNKTLNIQCKYSDAPVKTKSRSITKCELDYKHRGWPHSQYILDFLRCSVQFDNIDDLLKACREFESMKFNSLPFNICIKNISRVKNGFSNIGDESWKSPLNEFTYYDVKFNVTIDVSEYNKEKKQSKQESNHYSLIGEIQFIVKFMLDAKKMGHSIYSFVRKQDLFDKIHKKLVNDTNNEIQIENNLRRMILSQNLTQFSLFFQIINEKENNYVLKNENMIRDFLKENKWNKGLKFFSQLSMFA